MKLPVVSGKEMLKILLKKGYYIRNQKGSHVHLRHPIKKPLTVPMHDTLDRGTLKQILKDAEISREELSELL
ncbi:MAG TPA: type II toxin-antitoxin system HicA family toxin [archaeon]|nr:type II toxin-antitoxin system HicA family toxin [archaeon]